MKNFTDVHDDLICLLVDQTKKFADTLVEDQGTMPIQEFIEQQDQETNSAIEVTQIKLKELEATVKEFKQQKFDVVISEKQDKYMKSV